MTTQIQVPSDAQLITVVNYAFQCFPGPLNSGWTPDRRERFWKYLAEYYPQFHNYMKWYGDEHALEKRLFEKYKTGKKS